MKDTIPFDWFKLFTVDELKEWMEGISEINKDQLLACIDLNTNSFQLTEYPAETAAIRPQLRPWFDEAIQSFDQVQLQKFLVGVTGRAIIPSTGFGSIKFTFDPDDLYPRMYTCSQAGKFGLLPQSNWFEMNYERFKGYLISVVCENTGFNAR